MNIDNYACLQEYDGDLMRMNISWLKQELRLSSHGYGPARGPRLLVDPETINL